MSATQDKSQRFTFLYTNMYKVYKSGVPHALIGPIVVLRDEPKPTLAQRITQVVRSLFT